MRDEKHRCSLALAIAALLAACGVEIPDATFACVTDGDCPPAFACEADGLCHRSAMDGGPRTDGGDASVDADEDGIPHGSDCDDDDPSIGSSGARSCRGECADGVETCAFGIWAACDAPADCSCDVGETRTVSCGRCGAREQECVDERFVDATECAGEGECVTGAIETEREGCGNCGSRTRTRACSAACAFGAWGAWGACTGEGECAVGAVESSPETCGAGGLCSMARTCGETCTWGAWGPPSCTGCVDGATESSSAPCGACGTGTQARVRTCASCEWRGWVDSGACTGVTGCTPDSVETGTQACGMCGTQPTTRSCDASCAWGAWAATGACTGETGICVPGTLGHSSRSCVNEWGEPGAIPRTRICQSDCLWGPWKEGECL